MADAPYLVDDAEEPTRIWVPGHLKTAAERAAALAEVVAEWEGLVEWFDLLETTAEAIASADAPLVWQRPEELSAEDRQAMEDWYGGEMEPWEDCEADDGSATPWTLLRLDT